MRWIDGARGSGRYLGRIAGCPGISIDTIIGGGRKHHTGSGGGSSQKPLRLMGMPEAFPTDGERILFVNAVDYVADFVIAEELAACLKDTIPEMIVVSSESHSALLVVAGFPCNAGAHQDG